MMCTSRTPAIEVAIVEGPVSPPDSVPPPTSGATCRFTGQTRQQRDPEHGSLVALEYHCYRSMAVDALRRLSKVAIDRWRADAVWIHHATGEVAIGEASVIIDVTCPHREEAFSACRWLIDTIKREVPIWKRECWETASTWSSGHPLAEGCGGVVK